MNNTNNFCANLRLLKEHSKLSLMKFSAAAHVPKSTMKSMLDGNAPYLDTACIVSNSLHILLSVLTGGELQPEAAEMMHGALMMLELYKELPTDKQKQAQRIGGELLELCEK